jgi:hypothetical protein
MTIAATPPAPPARARRAAAALLPAIDPPLARRVLGEAALLGLTADALLRDAIGGIALPLWIALLAATFISIAWRADRRVTGETGVWLLVAILAAGTVAWRSAELLRVAGFATMLGALALAALSFRDRHAGLRAERLRDTVWAGLHVVRGVIGGFVPLVIGEALVPGEAPRAGRRLMPWLRAAVITAVLVLVFGSLLRSADPLFASLVALPDVDVGTLLSHLFVAGFFCWITSGWARAALDAREPSAPPALGGARLGGPEITTALGALNLLFAAYLMAQLGWFFGGERLLRERTGLTAAAYARDGFFQMVLVVGLVIPVLMATRAMLPDDRALRRRHAMLAMPLIALLGLMIASAFSRMQLYVHYYGLTIDRFYPMVLMTWLGGVLAWFGWTVLRERGSRFVGGALVSGLLVLGVMTVVSPDVLVARIDIARARDAGADPLRQLDLGYLATLSGEAVPIVVEATLASAPAASDVEGQRQRCTAASRLLEAWGPSSRVAARRHEEGAWRSWNAGEARALRAVGEAAPALRAIARTDCPRSTSAPAPSAATAQ